MTAPSVFKPVLKKGRLPAFTSILYWTSPALLCLLLYWHGLLSGYMRDDFAWLALHQSVHDIPSFLNAVFEPLAQGTIRPLSERLFFMAGWTFFGMSALPMRVAVFAVQFANLALLMLITRRLTGSPSAGLLAPVLWLVNANIYYPMVWTSAFNQILCALFLLLAFYLFLRYIDSGDRRFYFGQWVAFLLGFGALELNVVYPAIAGLYAVCCARKFLAGTLPMFGVSGVYAVVHRAAAPPQQSETYRMFFDAGLIRSFFEYVLAWAGAGGYADFRGIPSWPFVVVQALILCGVVAFAGWMIYRRQWLAAFLIGWFVIALAPVLPLRNHFSDYYLTVPALGLSILGAWAVKEAMNSALRNRAAALVLLVLYCVPSAWGAVGMTAYLSGISREVQTFVSSVAYAHRQHPDKILLIRGVDFQLFWSGWWDNPFRLFGRNDIYIDAASQPHIGQAGEPRPISRHFLADTMALAGFKNDRIEVYRVVDGSRLQRETIFYRAKLERSPDMHLPKYLDPAKPLSSVHLGEGWWRADGPYRWTAKRATLELRGPTKSGSALRIEGVCPEQHVARGPLELTVTVDNRVYPVVRIDSSNLHFRAEYPLQEQTLGKPLINVAVEVDRTLKVKGDPRELGVAFGTFEIVP